MLNFSLNEYYSTNNFTYVSLFNESKNNYDFIKAARSEHDAFLYKYNSTTFAANNIIQDEITKLRVTDSNCYYESLMWLNHSTRQNLSAGSKLSITDSTKDEDFF